MARIKRLPRKIKKILKKADLISKGKVTFRISTVPGATTKGVMTDLIAFAKSKNKGTIIFDTGWQE